VPRERPERRWESDAHDAVDAELAVESLQPFESVEPVGSLATAE
jgi:hypothetical protein